MKVLIVKILRNITLSLFVVSIFATIFVDYNQVFAADGCLRVGQCVNNKKCICVYGGPDNVRNYECTKPNNLAIGDQDCGSAIIGGVTPPNAVTNINSNSGGEIGAIYFISRAINFANIVAGIMVMINIVVAGFLYITGAGSASNMTKINERMLWSLVGILVIVGSYGLAGIFGLVFYGDPSFIINPTLTGALELSQ